MKQTFKFSPIVLLFTFLFMSCNLLTELQNSASKLTFKVTTLNKTNSEDSVVFSGKNMKSYNNTTGEVIFIDSTTISKVTKYRKFSCYLGADSLFAFSYATDYMSAMINDLVLYENLSQTKYYFNDGYPYSINDTNPIRIQNKEKRAAAWARFITQLKLEGRYKE